jgi:hypothetical protein
MPGDDLVAPRRLAASRTHRDRRVSWVTANHRARERLDGRRPGSLGNPSPAVRREMRAIPTSSDRGSRLTANSSRRSAIGDRRSANGKRQTANGKRQTASGEE